MSGKVGKGLSGEGRCRRGGGKPTANQRARVRGHGTKSDQSASRDGVAIQVKVLELSSELVGPGSNLNPLPFEARTLDFEHFALQFLHSTLQETLTFLQLQSELHPSLQLQFTNSWKISHVFNAMTPWKDSDAGPVPRVWWATEDNARRLVDVIATPVIVSLFYYCKYVNILDGQQIVRHREHMLAIILISPFVSSLCTVDYAATWREKTVISVAQDAAITAFVSTIKCNCGKDVVKLMDAIKQD
uniref:Uncharacterized protein n=1 Tax=Timema tahoe TaxID=61484 RepID=A0A7R9IST9_9NEOP|nr:unnamed protein product [Timema tahoe]